MSWRHDSNLSDLDMTLSCLSDVGRLPKFKMAAIETRSSTTVLNFGNSQRRSVSAWSQMAGMVANMGVAGGIGSLAQSVQLLFPFPVSVAASLIVGSWPTSGNVGQCRQYHIHDGQGRKNGVEVGIAAPSLAVQKLYPLTA